MGELVIKEHDFKEAKESIKQFSEQTAVELELRKVNDKKSFGEWVGDAFIGADMGIKHKVTGDELNNLTIKIQTHLNSINGTQIKIIKEFGEIYNALEALDKDYIQGILISIKATEVTSEGIRAHQKQLDKIISDQKSTLEVFKKFKQRLDTYIHLGDVDKIWNDCQRWNEEIKNLSSYVSQAISESGYNSEKIQVVEAIVKTSENNVANFNIELKAQIKRIEDILVITNELDKIIHLQDVDKMWKSLAETRDSLQYIYGEIERAKEVKIKQQTSIDKLLIFEDAIRSDKHLNNIDQIWNMTEKLDSEFLILKQQNENTLEIIKDNKESIVNLSEYKKQLSSISHLTDIDELWHSNKECSSKIVELQKQDLETKNCVENNKELVDKTIKDLKELNGANDLAIKNLNKKVKFSYINAGSSLAISIIELAIILTRTL